MTEIVQRAMVRTVCNIGQLSPQDKRELDAAVRKGWLSKGKGGPFPNVKTVWAHPGFDFAEDRKIHIDHAMYLRSLDVAAGVVSR